MSDQRIPVEIFTEATWEIEMLSSLLPNRRRFTRLTRSGLTTMRVGNHRFPLVQRLAVKSLSMREQEDTQAFTRHTLDRRDGRVRPFALRADRYAWETPTWAVLVKAEQRVVSHAGILYRVVEVGGQRVAVGGVCGVMTVPDWQGRGYARAVLKKAEAFVAVWLWAPFVLAICPRENASFYRSLGWQVAEAPITCEQPGGRVSLTDEVAVVLPCQGPALWPSGPIDLCGVPW